MSKQLLKSTSIVGLMTFISRILGYVRDMVAAHYFGAGLSYDAFLMAFKIPNFMRRLFAEGAFSQAFVPILAEYRSNRSESEVKDFINKVSGTLSLVLLGVTLLGVLGAPIVVLAFAPGFTGEPLRFLLATDMLRITFPYLLLISLTAFLGSVLNSFGNFAIPALTPVFLNICMIISAYCFGSYFTEPVMALAIGVFLGGIVQLSFLLPFLWRRGLFPKPTIGWQDPGVRRIIKLMIPALLGVSVNQLNLLIDSSFASFLPVGSVSWLYYSDRLMEFPLGIFGVAIATVVLPNLSRQHAVRDTISFSHTLDWGLRMICLIGMPSCVGLYLLAGPLLSTLFQSGHFTNHDVVMSSKSLMAYSVGVMGFMLVKILASAYYARQDIKTPVKIAMSIVVIHVILNAIFIKFWHHAGLALATSLAALLNAALLFWILKKRKLYQALSNWKKYALQLAFANSILAAVIIKTNYSMDQWLAWNRSERMLALLMIILVGACSYLSSLWVSGIRVQHLLMART